MCHGESQCLTVHSCVKVRTMDTKIQLHPGFLTPRLHTKNTFTLRLHLKLSNISLFVQHVQ